MAKFYGAIGFAEDVEEEAHPGVYVDSIIEKMYTGDVVRSSRRREPGEGANPDFNISNEFSIIMDPYAMSNFHKIRYIEWMGTKWTVYRVDVEYPRLLIEVGGVYNGPTA